MVKLRALDKLEACGHLRSLDKLEACSHLRALDKLEACLHFLDTPLGVSPPANVLVRDVQLI